MSRQRRRSALRRASAFAALAGAAGTGQLALAAELPEHGPGVLSDILAQSEFQPRIVKESILQQKLAEGINWVIETARDLFDGWSTPSLDIDPDSPILRLLIAIADFFSWIFEGLALVLEAAPYILVSAALLYLLYRLVRKLSGPEPLLQSAASDAPRAPEPSLDELYRTGRHDELLARLRRCLRQEWSEKYSCSDSLTNREVQRLLPAAEVKRSLFVKTAQLFERRVFAGRSVGAEEVAGLYRELQTIEGSA